MREGEGEREKETGRFLHLQQQQQQQQHTEQHTNKLFKEKSKINYQRSKREKRAPGPSSQVNSFLDFSFLVCILSFSTSVRSRSQ